MDVCSTQSTVARLRPRTNLQREPAIQHHLLQEATRVQAYVFYARIQGISEAPACLAQGSHGRHACVRCHFPQDVSRQSLKKAAIHVRCLVVRRGSWHPTARPAWWHTSGVMDARCTNSMHD